MGRSIFDTVVPSIKGCRDDSLVTCNMPLYAAVTKYTILKTATTMSRLFGNLLCNLSKQGSLMPGLWLDRERGWGRMEHQSQPQPAAAGTPQIKTKDKDMIPMLWVL